MRGRIVQISISLGGVPKTAVPEARVTALGLDGDAHRDREHHGGPERAVRRYAMEAIARPRVEGHDIVPALSARTSRSKGWTGRRSSRDATSCSESRCSSK